MAIHSHVGIGRMFVDVNTAKAEMRNDDCAEIDNIIATEAYDIINNVRDLTQGNPARQTSMPLPRHSCPTASTPPTSCGRSMS